MKLFPKIAIKRGKIFIKHISSAIIHAYPSTKLRLQGTYESKKNKYIIPVNLSMQYPESSPKSRNQRHRSQGNKNHPYSLSLTRSISANKRGRGKHTIKAPVAIIDKPEIRPHTRPCRTIYPICYPVTPSFFAFEIRFDLKEQGGNRPPCMQRSGPCSKVN